MGFFYTVENGDNRKKTLHSNQVAMQALLSSGLLDEEKLQLLQDLTNASILLIQKMSVNEDNSSQMKMLETENCLIESPTSGEDLSAKDETPLIKDFGSLEFLIDNEDGDFIPEQDFVSQYGKKPERLQIISDCSIHDNGIFIELEDSQQGICNSSVLRGRESFTFPEDRPSTSKDNRFSRPVKRVRDTTASTTSNNPFRNTASTGLTESEVNPHERRRCDFGIFID